MGSEAGQIGNGCSPPDLAVPRSRRQGLFRGISGRRRHCSTAPGGTPDYHVEPTRPTDLAWRGDTPVGAWRLAPAHARGPRRAGAGGLAHRPRCGSIGSPALTVGAGIAARRRFGEHPFVPTTSGIRSCGTQHDQLSVGRPRHSPQHESTRHPCRRMRSITPTATP
jgi:hypothetical protein